MRTAIPHSLPREEVRRRLRKGSHEIADFLPGGIGEVQTGWSSDDMMTLDISAMGQTVSGTVTIEETQVVLDITLPPALSFLENVVESAVQKQGQKLLAPA